jgi:hypothetical protein
MSKRKREDDSENDVKEGPDLKLKVSRLKARIQQSVKALHNALKLARGFERQKLGRRQKKATDQPQVLLRLREEVIVLKQLNLERIAKDQLLKHLRKVKRIKEHAVFVQAYGREGSARPAKSGAEANLIGRLFNSKPVKEVMSDIVKVILKSLGLAQVATPSSKASSKEALDKPTGSSNNRADGGFLGNGEEDSAAWQDESVLSQLGTDDEGTELYADRLGSSDDDESNIMSSDDDLVRPVEAVKGTTSAGLSVKEASESDEEETETREEAPRASKTAFVPSLSLGGYYSGSESEDEKALYHGPALPKPRKNRRGQRARQHLAEQKYGQSAKHLTKQNNRPNGDAGWDPKRGAVGSSHSRTDRARHPKHGDQKQDENGKSSTDSSHHGRRKGKVEEGPMHPSWEAAKKRKMQTQNPAAFQGRKITFD